MGVAIHPGAHLTLLHLLGGTSLSVWTAVILQFYQLDWSRVACQSKMRVSTFRWWCSLGLRAPGTLFNFDFDEGDFVQVL